MKKKAKANHHGVLPVPSKEKKTNEKFVPFLTKRNKQHQKKKQDIEKNTCVFTFLAALIVLFLFFL